MNFVIWNFTEIQFLHNQKHDHQLKHDQSHKCKSDISWIYFFHDGKNRDDHHKKYGEK